MKSITNLYIFLLLFIMAGCVTSAVQKLSPMVYYRNDICFVYKPTKEEKKNIKTFIKRFGQTTYRDRVFKKDEIEFCGVGALPYSPSYDLGVKSFGSMNFFSLTTCHEEATSENRDKGIFKKTGETDIKYIPTIEEKLDCPLFVSAYSKSQKHAWGLLVFENPRYKLDATVYCNGYVTEAHGVSICQAKEGLIQEISFPEEVYSSWVVPGAADRKSPCPKLSEWTIKDKKTYQFKMPPRECIYGFMTRDKKIHQLHTVGYEDIIIRE